MIIDTDQLVTQSQVAEMTGMTRHLLAHHLAKPDAPKPVFIGSSRHAFYDVREVLAWTPKRNSRRQKP
jgi:predicted DNA-binding transcriptional regulator AlpA